MSRETEHAVAIRPGQQLSSLGPEVSGQVMTHPAQRVIVDRIVELIEWLRVLEQPADFYAFQRQLFGLLYQVEEPRGQCSRMIKRLQCGRGAPLDACDLLMFETITSDRALMESFERARLRGEVLLTPGSGQLAGAMGVVRGHLGRRALTWHAYGLGVLLFELAEPDTLTRGSAELLRMASPPSEPTIAYTGETETWLPRL